MSELTLEATLPTSSLEYFVSDDLTDVNINVNDHLSSISFAKVETKWSA